MGSQERRVNFHSPAPLPERQHAPHLSSFLSPAGPPQVRNISRFGLQRENPVDDGFSVSPNLSFPADLVYTGE